MAARVHFESKHTSIPSDNVTGTGTINQVAKFTGANAIGDSIITDNGTNVGIGTTIPSLKLDVEGSVNNADIGIRINNTFDDNNPASNPTSVLFLNAASNNGYLRVYGAPANTASKHQIDLGSSAGDSFLTFSPNGGEKMRIDSAGNVGIGTSSPNTTLYVNGGNANNVVTFESTDDAARIILKDDDTAGYFIAKDNVISIGGSTTIANNLNVDVTSGNVGIGTDDPDYKLHVKGSVALDVMPGHQTEGTIRIGRYDNNTSRYNDIKSYVSSTAASNYLKFSVHGGVENATVDVMTLKGSGNVGIGTTSPGAKLEISGNSQSSTPALRINCSDSSVQLDQVAGSVEFSVTDASSPGAGVKSSINSIALNSIGSRYGLGFNTTSGVNNVERMRIDQDGNVGIGTSTPNAKLDIQGTQGQLFSVTDDLSGSIFAVADISGVPIFDVNSSGVSYFDGNVGIGITNPSEKLHVVGNAFLSANSAFKASYNNTDSYHGSMRWAGLQLGNNGVNKIVAGRTAAGGSFQFWTNNTNDAANYTVTADGIMTMAMTNAGNVGIGTTSPGAKLNVAGDILIDSGEYISWGTVGSTSIEGSTASNKLQFRTNSSDRMIIDSSGNVGIGTTSPSSPLGSTKVLDISSTGNGEVILDHTDAGVSSDLGLYSWARSNDHLAHIKATCEGATDAAFISFHAQPSGGSFSNAASNEKMRIQSNGYVGIGTTSPDIKLDIVSGLNNGIRISATDTTQIWRDIDIRSYVSQAQADALTDGSAIYTTNPTSQTETAFQKYGGLVLQGRDDGNSSFAIRLGNGNGYATRMYMGGTGATVFSNTVTATNFILSSDERLKENIEKACDNRIKADWKTFELKTDKGQKRYGVIAQELEKTNPEFVREDTQGFKSVAYIDLLIAKIAELEARLEKAGI